MLGVILLGVFCAQGNMGGGERGREEDTGPHNALVLSRGPKILIALGLGLVMHVAKPKELGECCLYGVAVGMIRTAPECGRRQLQRLCGDGATTLWCLHYSPPMLPRIKRHAREM